jgi:hypothetical protein
MNRCCTLKAVVCVLTSFMSGVQAAAAAKKLKEEQEKEYTSWYKRADLTETTGVMRLVRELITALTTTSDNYFFTGS